MKTLFIMLIISSLLSCGRCKESDEKHFTVKMMDGRILQFYDVRAWESGSLHVQETPCSKTYTIGQSAYEYYK